MRSLRRELVGLLVILVTFASLAAGHAWRTPMFEGPDEDSNLEYVAFLDVEGRLARPSTEPTPELEALERGILPPLWFLQALPVYRGLGLSGVTATPVMNGGFLRDPQFHSEVSAAGLTLDQALARPGSRNRYLHGRDEAPGATGPGADAVRSLRWLRLAAIPWGCLALVAAHGAIRRSLGRGRRALWFTAALALTPQLQFLSANINMDAMNTSGRTRDIIVVGAGSSELEDYLEVAATSQGRYLRDEATPERGFYYRSDHFNFAKVGIPALYAESGIDHVEFGQEYGAAQGQDYTDNRYHQPSDEYDASWDLSGGVEDIQLYFEIASRLANEESFPNWYEGNEFKSIRDASADQRR